MLSKDILFLKNLSLKRRTYHLCGIAAGLQAISVEQLIQVLLKMTGVTWTEQANFFLKSANHKSANYWAHSADANPQILWCAGPQIAIPHFFIYPHGILRGPGETDS